MLFISVLNILFKLQTIQNENTNTLSVQTYSRRNNIIIYASLFILPITFTRYKRHRVCKL